MSKLFLKGSCGCRFFSNQSSTHSLTNQLPWTQVSWLNESSLLYYCLVGQQGANKSQVGAPTQGARQAAAVPLLGCCPAAPPLPTLLVYCFVSWCPLHPPPSTSLTWRWEPLQTIWPLLATLPLVARAPNKCGHATCKNHSLTAAVLLIAPNFRGLCVPFAQQQVRLIQSHYCFLTGQVEIPGVWLMTHGLSLCSIYPFERCRPGSTKTHIR